MNGLLTIELLHFTILSSFVGDDASGGLALQGTGEVRLLLPRISLLLVTIKSTTTGIATLQVLSSEIFGLGASEYLALPILLLTRRNWMMQHTVANLISSLIVAKDVRAREGSRLALTNACTGASKSRSLHDLTSALGAEDVRVLV